jgi:hypothetical protein
MLMEFLFNVVFKKNHVKWSFFLTSHLRKIMLMEFLFNVVFKKNHVKWSFFLTSYLRKIMLNGVSF